MLHCALPHPRCTNRNRLNANALKMWLPLKVLDQTSKNTVPLPRAV